MAEEVEEKSEAQAGAVSMPESLDREMKQREAYIYLSTTENAILLYLIRGVSNKLIARGLNVAEPIIKEHLRGLLRKIRASCATREKECLSLPANAERDAQQEDLGPAGNDPADWFQR